MKTIRPYWERHPYQLAVVLRLFALLLLVALPFIYVYKALQDHWDDFKGSLRFLLSVIRHGEKAA